MTLDTNIYVRDEIDPKRVFDKCRELLGATDANPYDDDESWQGEGARLLANACGQGLPAWLMLHYRPGAPLRAERTYCTDCSEDGACETRCSQEPTYLTVSFDTAYGYRDEQGRGCGDLHACYIAELGRWLDEQGIAWAWQNEFTGEVHEGDDRYTKLTRLMQGGADATAWFSSTVLPAITASIMEGHR